MCRYQAWEDDLPEHDDVHEEIPEERRHVVTALISQIEERTNEMRAIVDSMKEMNAARRKSPNRFFSGFLSGICFTLMLGYVFKCITGKKSLGWSLHNY